MVEMGMQPGTTLNMNENKENNPGFRWGALKERLKDSLNWKNIKTLWIINTLIAVLINLILLIVSFTSNLEILALRMVIFLIWSHAIGHAIFFWVVLFEVSRESPLWKRFLSLLVAFILGGWSGTLLAWSIDLAFFHIHHNLKSLFIINTLLAIFFGAIVNSYFALRTKLQETASRLAEKEIDEQRLQRLKTRAELEALRTRVNPHFLFNTLNSIASLIHSDPGKAEDMVQKLANLFRYTLESSNRDFIKLSDELQLVQEYLDIEKIRLGERLAYEIECDEETGDCSIPAFILQPLVENSVKHGIAPAKSGGKVWIRCWQNDEFCQIEVRDNGRGFDRNRVEQGFGLRGVRERLDLYYGDRHVFEISTGEGVYIRLKLPLSNRDENASQ